MKRTLKAELRQSRPFPTLEEEVFLQIQRTAQESMRWVLEALRPARLSPSQFNVLRILRGARPEAVTCGDIGERMVTRDPDLTRLLDRLEAAGMVTKSRDADDRRVVNVRITPAGLRAVERASEAVSVRLQAAMGPMGRRRLESLADLLEVVRGKSG